MRIDDDAILILSPFTLIYVWIEVVIPALAALLAQATVELTRDKGPLLVSVDLHQTDYCGVLLRGPRTLNETRLEHLLPAMQALHIGSFRESGSNLLPILASELLDCPPKKVIFFFCPLSHRSPTLGRGLWAAISFLEICPHVHKYCLVLFRIGRN